MITTIAGMIIVGLFISFWVYQLSHSRVTVRHIHVNTHPMSYNEVINYELTVAKLIDREKIDLDVLRDISS